MHQEISKNMHYDYRPNSDELALFELRARLKFAFDPELDLESFSDSWRVPSSVLVRRERFPVSGEAWPSRLEARAESTLLLTSEEVPKINSDSKSSMSALVRLRVLKAGPWTVDVSVRRSSNWESRRMLV